MSTYSEKLRDPRWQKKRLEIMNRDDFTCQNCGNSDRTLNVDHQVYRKNANPWDYDDADLWTLCEDCHQNITAARQRIADEVGRMNGFELDQLEAFLDNRTICDEVTIVIDANAYKMDLKIFQMMLCLWTDTREKEGLPDGLD